MGQKVTSKAFLRYYCASDPCVGLILCRIFANDCSTEKRKVLVIAVDDIKYCQYRGGSEYLTVISTRPREWG